MGFSQDNFYLGLNTCVNGLIDNNFYVMKQNNRRFDFSEKNTLHLQKDGI